MFCLNYIYSSPGATNPLPTHWMLSFTHPLDALLYPPHQGLSFTHPHGATFYPPNRCYPLPTNWVLPLSTHQVLLFSHPPRALSPPTWSYPLPNHLELPFTHPSGVTRVICGSGRVCVCVCDLL